MMITTRTTTDELLTTFFSAQREGVKGLRYQRIVRVERRLRDCLETEGHRILVDSDLTRLRAEQILDPDGAFARMAGAGDLVFVLSIFIEPQWLMTDPLDRRAQLTLADKLTGFVLTHRLVDRDEYVCPLLDIRGGIDRARSELRRAAQSTEG